MGRLIYFIEDMKIFLKHVKIIQLIFLLDYQQINLHLKKNIYPNDNYESRSQNIYNFCKEPKTNILIFPEEKMELKNEYTKNIIKFITHGR